MEIKVLDSIVDPRDYVPHKNTGQHIILENTLLDYCEDLAVWCNSQIKMALSKYIDGYPSATQQT